MKSAWGRSLAFALAIAGLGGTRTAVAAWHDAFPGAGVAVHYVHLSGYGGDNEANRRNLLARHQGCMSMRAALGQTGKALPAEGVPAIVSTQDIEIYYASSRTLTIKQGTLYDIDPIDCALVGVAHQVVEIAWAGGKCDADMVRKVALGSCDAAALAAGATAPLRPETANVTTGDETRVVAGMACRVQRLAPGFELCIAHPTAAQSPDPDPIPAAPLNGGMRGLLLEAHTPALTLQAKEARLNLSVPKEMFALPTGLRVNAGPKG